MNAQQPLIIMVAPNGARKKQSDHEKLPVTPAELGETALQCYEAGASMIHLHVRDNQQHHILDVERYQAAIEHIRQRCGPEFIIQVTTESVGQYSPDAQIKLVRELKPEAVSLAVRELCLNESQEAEAGKFFAWMRKENVSPQYILYSVEDIFRFMDLRKRGIIPGERCSVLYVLGRYHISGESSPSDILPFLSTMQDDVVWSVCAFGSQEAACLITAAGLGGHCRLGFENNTRLITGETAADNTALVNQFVQYCTVLGRKLASPSEARYLLGME